MDTTDILIEAYRRGHSFNPEYPNLRNLDIGRVALMTGEEQDAKDLLSSRQKSDINYETLVQAFHRREPNYDGEVGPATKALVNIPRCPIPDFPIPEDAAFDTGISELNEVIETQKEFHHYMNSVDFAMGTGSWPSCDPSRKGVNSLRVNLNLTKCPTTIRNYLDKALKAVRECYAEVGLAVRYIYDGDPKDCEIEKKFDNLTGSVIGWNEFPTPNTCKPVISGRLDTGYAPSDYRYWANLEAHETGHGVGLNHGKGHIMNPSILLVWPLSFKGSYSEPYLNKWFGGVPIPVDGSEPLPINPPINGNIFGELKDSRIYIRGQLVLIVDENTPNGAYKYTVVPEESDINKFRLVQSAEV